MGITVRKQTHTRKIIKQEGQISLNKKENLMWNKKEIIGIIKNDK